MPSISPEQLATIRRVPTSGSEIADLRARVEELGKRPTQKMFSLCLERNEKLFNELSAEREKVKKLWEKINDIIEEESAKEDWDEVILKYAREALAESAPDGGE